MVNKVIPISLDLKRVTSQPQTIPMLVEGDNGNFFVITLTDDGVPVNLHNCRVLAVFSKVADGTTSEQDTEDAYIELFAYGIELSGGIPVNGSTITVTSDGLQTVTVETTVADATVTIDAEKWLERMPNAGGYTISYVTAGPAWQMGDHSVVISGENENIITIALKTSSYGNGKNNCELQIYSGPGKKTLVTTAQFNFDGRKGILNSETVRRDPQFPILTTLIAKVSEMIGKTGDMSKAIFDPNGTVENAGGIEQYLLDRLGSFIQDLDVGDSVTALDQLAAYNPTEDTNKNITVQQLSSYFSGVIGGQMQTKLQNLVTQLNSAFGQVETTVNKNKVIALKIAAISSLPYTVSDSRITEDMLVVEHTVDDPSVMRSDWTVTTANGSITVSGSIAAGETTALDLILMDAATLDVTEITVPGDTPTPEPEPVVNDYTRLANKPQINTVTLTGNKLSTDLNLQEAMDSMSNSDIEWIIPIND